MFRCYSCKNEKEEKDFHLSSLKYNDYICKECKKVKGRIYGARYRKKHKEQMYSNHKKWYRANRENILKNKRIEYANGGKEYWHKNYIEKKLKVLNYYSKGTMACADPYHLHLPNDPFLTDLRCSSLDHIKGNGAKQRKEINSIGGKTFYTWVIDNNYPSGYQVLCMNCQWVKRNINNEV